MITLKFILASLVFFSIVGIYAAFALAITGNITLTIHGKFKSKKKSSIIKKIRNGFRVFASTAESPTTITLSLIVCTVSFFIFTNIYEKTVEPYQAEYNAYRKAQEEIEIKELKENNLKTCNLFNKNVTDRLGEEYKVDCELATGQYAIIGEDQDGRIILISPEGKIKYLLLSKNSTN